MVRSVRSQEDTMRKLCPYEYNTEGGIAQFVWYYPHFHALLRARHEAAKSGEVLNKFVVLGAFVLEENGRTSKLSPVPRDIIHNVPDVIKFDQFDEYIQGKILQGTRITTIINPVWIPPEYIRCSSCGKIYDTSDCHDVSVSVREEVVVPLDDFVGKTLGDVCNFLFLNDEIVHKIVNPYACIRNDARIEPRVDRWWRPWKVIHSPDGWVGVEDGITDKYVIQPGDETKYIPVTYTHKNRCVPKKVTE